jgi:hypothetical protein
MRMPERTVLVEFTVHTGDEILREGGSAGDWKGPLVPNEAALFPFIK